MDTDLQTVADERAIIDLACRYCWALDRHEFDDLRNIFLPDASARLGETDCSSVLTRLDASQHLAGNHVVDLDGDRATHRCYLQAQQVLHEAEGGHLWKVAGVYDDECFGTPDGWRIPVASSAASGPTATPAWRHPTYARAEPHRV